MRQSQQKNASTSALKQQMSYDVTKISSAIKENDFSRRSVNQSRTKCFEQDLESDSPLKRMFVKKDIDSEKDLNKQGRLTTLSSQNGDSNSVSAYSPRKMRRSRDDRKKLKQRFPVGSSQHPIIEEETSKMHSPVLKNVSNQKSRLISPEKKSSPAKSKRVSPLKGIKENNSPNDHRGISP